MRKSCLCVLLLSIIILAGCRWKVKSVDGHQAKQQVAVERYDLLELRYLTTGDYGALKQMNTDYPAQTMTLVEHVLKLGHLDEPGINERFYEFFQDSTLQQLVADVQKEYDSLDDIDRELTQAFARLQQMFPHLSVPRIYAQVTALDQSIIVDSGQLAVSLDKYLGADYPLYLHYGYSEQQRQTMTRQYIVPDCVAFYLLSVYADDNVPDLRPRLQYVVNEAVGRKVFANEQVEQVAQYMKSHRQFTVDRLLTDTIQII